MSLSCSPPAGRGGVKCAVRRAQRGQRTQHKGARCPHPHHEATQTTERAAVALCLEWIHFDPPALDRVSVCSWTESAVRPRRRQARFSTPGAIRFQRPRAASVNVTAVSLSSSSASSCSAGRAFIVSLSRKYTAPRTGAFQSLFHRQVCTQSALSCVGGLLVGCSEPAEMRQEAEIRVISRPCFADFACLGSESTAADSLA